jgi:hypothetical protein
MVIYIKLKDQIAGWRKSMSDYGEEKAERGDR